MSNPVWRGDLVFGAAKFPVKLFSAARAETISFNQLHRPDNSRVKQILVCGLPDCPSHDKPIPKEDIVKGYEIEKGRYLTFSDEDLVRANPPIAKVLDISAFADAAEIDSLVLESSYYLAPAGEDEAPYATLLAALRKTGTVGLTQIEISTRRRAALIRAGGTGIVLHTLFYVPELRRLDEFRPDLRLGADKDRDAAVRVIKGLTKVFSLPFVDRQRENLLAMIAAKLKAAAAPAQKKAKG